MRNVAIASAVLAGSLAAGGPARVERSEAQLRAATAAWAAALPEAARARASQPFEAPDRFDWHYVPRERPGLPLGAMDERGRIATHALLREFLTPRGYLRVEGVLGLEQVLREAEEAAGRDGSWRDPLRYHVTLFGDAAGPSPWGLRFEGHHVSLNFTGAAGGLVATPLFLGANPEVVRGGRRAGFALLAPIGELARELMRALPEALATQALIAVQAPADVLFGPGRDAPDFALGVVLREMPAAAREQARALAAALPWCDLRGVAGVALDDDARFAWAGSVAPGEPHYWRLVSGDAIAEWDDTQDGANHVHLLIRDRSHDFGADLLARHHHEEARRSR